MVTSPSRPEPVRPCVELVAELEHLHVTRQLPYKYRRGTGYTWNQTVMFNLPEWAWPYFRHARSRWDRYLSWHPDTRVLWFCWRYRTTVEGAAHRRDYCRIRYLMEHQLPELKAAHPETWIEVLDQMVDAYLEPFPHEPKAPMPRMPVLVGSWEGLLLSVKHQPGPGDVIDRHPHRRVCVCAHEVPVVADPWWVHKLDRTSSSPARRVVVDHAPPWRTEEEWARRVQARSMS